MTITLSWPVIAIILFVLVTQIWAWTRHVDRDYYFGSLFCARNIAVFCMTVIDLFFIAIVGGIWIW